MQFGVFATDWGTAIAVGSSASASVANHLFFMARKVKLPAISCRELSTGSEKPELLSHSGPEVFSNGGHELLGGLPGLVPANKCGKVLGHLS